MKQISSFINYIRFAKSSKLLILSAFVLISGSLLAFSALNQSRSAQAANCSDNDIIRCGATSAGDLAAKYNANTSGDLKAIYQQFGLSPDEISRFTSTAKMGTAYKDGRVVVDGKVVATEVNSLGRTTLGGKNNVPITIGGKTYHYGSNSSNFGSDSLPTLVMMNPDTHEMEFAALTACGNPVWGKSPKYKCSMLNREDVDRDTFNFSTSVVAESGATVSRVVYDFGDGETQTVTDPGQKVSHTYAEAGDYTAKVTVYFSVNGREESDTRKECTKPVEVKPEAPNPVYECTALTARKITRTKYEFTATTHADGGATLKDADFDFGDGQSAKGIKPKDEKKIVIEHEYAKEGSYKIATTVNFNIANEVKSNTCKTEVTVDNQPPEECKPGIPEGDEQCEEKPVSLPSTGPAEIFGSAVGLGSVVTAGGYYLRSRRDLLSVIFKR